MKLKKFTGLLLCAALALSMAACKFTTPAVVMTVAGMLMCGLILVLVYGLMQQLITFVMTVVNELLLRTV